MQVRSSRRWKVAAIAATAAASWSFACEASRAATATSYDPSTIVSALQDAGYKAKISKGADGDPFIESGSSGNDFKLTFAGCTKGKECDQIEFVAIWDCTAELKICAQTSEKWNAEENYSHAIIIGNNIALYYHLLFDKSGISPTLFIKNVEYFAADAMNISDLFVSIKGK